MTVEPALSKAMCTAETAAAAVQAKSGTWSVSGVKNVDNQKHPDDEALALC